MITKEEIEKKADEMYGDEKRQGDSWSFYSFVNGANWAQNKILETASEGFGDYCYTEQIDDETHQFDIDEAKYLWQYAKLSSAKEIEELNIRVESESAFHIEAARLLTELQKERDELVEALEFYSSEINWCSYGFDTKNVISEYDLEILNTNGHTLGGKRAREYIEKYKPIK